MFNKMERSSFNTFMDKYVQYDGIIPDDNYFAGLFDEVPFGRGQEAHMYAPFVSL